MWELVEFVFGEFFTSLVEIVKALMIALFWGLAVMLIGKFLPSTLQLPFTPSFLHCVALIFVTIAVIRVIRWAVVTARS